MEQSLLDFLSVLKPEQIDALARTAPIVQYPAGAMIVRKGAMGDSLFDVASGRVEILAERAGGGPLMPSEAATPATSSARCRCSPTSRGRSTLGPSRTSSWSCSRAT